MPENEVDLTEILVELAKQRTILERMQRDVLEIKDELKERYVTKEQFDPVQKLVYGMVGLILVAVITALMALLVRGQVP